jgi:hypothetical protein
MPGGAQAPSKQAALSPAHIPALALALSHPDSCRWRTYLQPGVKHTTQEPFSEWEVAVVQEVRLQGGFGAASLPRRVSSQGPLARSNQQQRQRCAA